MAPSAGTRKEGLLTDAHTAGQGPGHWAPALLDGI